MFCDITWGAGGSTAELTLDIAANMQNGVCCETMMHLTCTNMPRESLRAALDRVKAEGIQNILALRGDPPKGAATFEAVEGGFACALDLVKYIKAEYGDHFGLTVAGYPEAHPDVIKSDPGQQAAAYASDLAYLKQKVDAGGEVVVTQLFYDVELFLKFVADCRSIGIRCPIVPGLMPIQTYAGFQRMTGFCKTYVPPEVAATLEGIKEDEEACRAYGIHLGVSMCRRMLAEGTPGVHLYSLNSDKAVTSILRGLGLIPAIGPPPPPLPFRLPVSSKGRRCEEAARPVFWANAPRAYQARTADWPHPLLAGGAAAAGPYAPADAELFERLRPKASRALASRAAALAGAPLATAAELRPLFRAFAAGGLAAWPWSESGQPSRTLRAAAAHAAAGARLQSLIDGGALILDAALPLQGAASGAAGGWGGPCGRIYQKSYLLALVPAARAPALAAAAAGGGGSAMWACGGGAASAAGPVPGLAPAPLAWAVFPGRPLVAPVVWSADSFEAAAEEAVGAWEGWAALFESNGDANSAAAVRAAAASHALLFACGEEAGAEAEALFAALQAAL